MSEKSFIENLSMSAVITGAVLLALTMFSTEKSGVLGYMTGYSFILSGILLMTGVKFGGFNSQLTGESVYSIIIVILPSILLAGIIIGALYLIGSHLDRIVSGRVSNYYYAFSIITALFVIIQSWFLFADASSKNTGSSATFNASKMNLLSLINIAALASMGIVLNYYVTDG